MSTRTGPRVNTAKEDALMTCKGCSMLDVVACVGDGGGGVGWEYWCKHPNADETPFIGWEGEVDTPPWCPCLKANRHGDTPSAPPDASKAAGCDDGAKSESDAA